MKTVLSAYLPNTNVEIEFQSDGEQLYFIDEIGAEPVIFGAKFENERDYVNGVLDTLKSFTKFKVSFIEQ